MDNEALERKKKHVAEEYLSSLSDLQCNSKPLINMLTMLAEENIELAPVIVQVVEQHINKVPKDLKLPMLYLIDSIVKNVKNAYVTLFGQCIVDIFCKVFEEVNEKVRERMYALRSTWNEVFPASKLYALDVRVRQIDTQWPIVAVHQPQATQPTAIHVNPNFLAAVPPAKIGDVIQVKTRELLELRKRKLELELEATKKRLEEQEKALSSEGDVLESSLVPVTSTQLPAAVAPAEKIPPIGFGSDYVRPSLSVARPNTLHNMMSTSTQMTSVMPQNVIRNKIHPVNPALVNSVRQRDPRLMRQQMQQQQTQMSVQQQQQLMRPMTTSNEPTAINQAHQTRQPAAITTEVSKRDNKRDKSSSKSHKSTSSPSSRSDGSKSSSSSTARHASSQRTSKSSSSSRDKDRDRESRKRLNGVNKTYSNYNRTQKNREKHETKSSGDIKGRSQYMRSSPSSSYRHSKSPNSSPIKSRDAIRRGSQTKNAEILRDRSNSPNDPIVSSTKDVDLRTTLNFSTETKTLSADRDSTSSSAIVSDAGDAPGSAVKVLGQNIENERKFVESAAVTMAATAATKPATATPRIKIEDEDLRQLLLPSTILMNASAINDASSAVMSQSQQLLLDVPFMPLMRNIACNRPLDIMTEKNTTRKTTTTNATISGNVLEASSSTSTKSSTPKIQQPAKVSFKIQKLFNKLAKSTENLANVTTTTAVAAATTSATSSLALKSNVNIEKDESSAKILKTKRDLKEDITAIDMDIEDDENAKTHEIRSDNNSDERRPKGDGKKRTSEASRGGEEPNAKKSKSAKMDALFGSEDVDLRTLAPPMLGTPIFSGGNDMLVAPPPPIISSSDDDQKDERSKQRENAKSNKTASTSQQKVSANFEDVRAKFAKATRLERLSKSERAAATTNRARAAAVIADVEPNANDDDNTQEANDEKIRIILSQAQEMLDSNSLNKEQYKKLVQTVMSINEQNKLKEAKRRESLQSSNNSKQTVEATNSETTIVIDDDDAAVDLELMAARDAVLKKRIPKLSKRSNEDASAHTKSPIAIEHDDERAEPIKNLNRLKPKEKRVRRSKWSDATRNESTSERERPWQQQVGNAASIPVSNVTSIKRNNSAAGLRSNTNNAIPPPPQPPSQPLPLIVGPNQIHLSPGSNWPQNVASANANNMSAAILPSLVRSSVPPPPQPPLNLPPVLPVISTNNLPKPCNSIDNPQADLVRTIHIDSQSKDIRIYDDVAIVFMDRDEPREIGFQPGQRAIIIDDQAPFTLRFNDEYKPIMIAGQMHRVRFGFPSRELYIDEHWYEIYFGGPPVSIPIQNSMHILKAEGPPPQVNIGPVRRDLVVGRITMIVEAMHIFTLFLDARIQIFRYQDEDHTVQFADGLLTVLLDGKPQQVVYGGLPKQFVLKGKRYFIRFTTLPEGVVAGKVYIKDMIYVNTQPPAASIAAAAQIDELPPRANENDEKCMLKGNDAATAEQDPTRTLPASTAAPALDKINIDELLQKLLSTGILNNNATKLSTQPTVLPTAAAATTSSATFTADSNAAATSSSELTEKIKEESSNGGVAVSVLSDEQSTSEAEKTFPPIIPIDLSKPKSIKTRQDAIVAALYLGMQCSSCGVRFPPEQTIRYSQHLDWHFRQNRRERDSTRKAHSRKWYYELNDWLQYEEIEDLDEREKNFFETQQCELEALDDISNQRSSNSPLPTCPAGPNDVDRCCDMCHEKFEQFYNEELEEWHLRLAIRVEDKIYHPLCYEDYKASLNSPAITKTASSKSTDEDVIMQDDDNAVDVVIKIEEDENVPATSAPPSGEVPNDDDDDDVIVLPNEEPSVTEIVDDEDEVGLEEEYVPVNVTREEMHITRPDNSTALESDADVVIQEPHIPFTDLDTYVEKDFGNDENTQNSFKTIKIKEEPKEHDEDDDFEDVGTVLYGPHDEISIQSSEDTQTHTILSSVGSPVTLGGEQSPALNMLNSTQATETTQTTTPLVKEVTDVNVDESSNISMMDGNVVEASDDGHHNLSINGPPPAVPLGSLVNRIKINITKNISTAAAANAMSTDPTTTTATITTNNLSSSNSNNNEAFNQNSIKTNVISTIPVLCGGSSHGTGSSSSISSSLVNTNINSNVSNITVIGSYGSSYQQKPPALVTLTTTLATSSTAAAAASAQQRQRTPTPPPVEDTITFDLKPALQKVTLKKMKKIECGVETSGLCSIM